MRITINGRDYTGRVDRVQRLWRLGRAWVLDVDGAGGFRATARGLKGHWVWGWIKEVENG